MIAFLLALCGNVYVGNGFKIAAAHMECLKLLTQVKQCLSQGGQLQELRLIVQHQSIPGTI